jgi:hypothetical protein
MTKRCVQRSFIRPALGLLPFFVVSLAGCSGSAPPTGGGPGCDPAAGIECGEGGAPEQCVAQEGQRCGGNTTHACTCAAGLHCVSDSNLPVGDVGGTCVRNESGGGNECSAASDCQGPLPQLCEVCASGKTACAHWVCQGGACETSICD